MKVLINEKLNAINKSIKWLSNITDVPYPTLSRIVKGEDLKSIPITTFDKICTALNCNISDILSTEEDETIKEKVKTENNKVIFEERLNILKSLNKIKTIVGTAHAEEYDQLAIKIEEVFNKTTFSNPQNEEPFLDLFYKPDIDAIIDNYNINNISNTPVKEVDLFSGAGGFKDSMYKLNYSEYFDACASLRNLIAEKTKPNPHKIKITNKENSSISTKYIEP